MGVMNQSGLMGFCSLAMIIFLSAGCASLSETKKMNEEYGPPNPMRYQIPPQVAQPGWPDYWKDIRPIMAKRCVVCHGCYDAPCQQNLTSWEGIIRGSNPKNIYWPAHLRAIKPTRLFIDAQTPSEWRKKKFHPVLNERNNTPEANLQGSALYRLLDLKRKHPLPDEPVLKKGRFDFSLTRKQVCSPVEKMSSYEKKHPLWGMPFGLIGLSAQEFSTMERWLVSGSPSGLPPVAADYQAKKIQEWETFFNGASLKEQLMSRYLYEHLFLADLHFDDHNSPDTATHPYYRLVRSSTPPGQPIEEIATRRPYEDPGTQSFWYRLRPDFSTVVVKTHLPYALNASRKKKWKSWFLEPNYEVKSLPSYRTKVASNPFISFKDIPLNSRYRFLLDEAHFTVDNFIKGPVCQGQVALSVIDDHFWVFFIDPDKISGELNAEFLAKESRNLQLPAESGSNARVVAWLKYSAMERRYLTAKRKFLMKNFGTPEKWTTSLIWDGDDTNNNAALTIFRHTDSASVVKGLVGPPPKTAWVVGYELLERIYYLLVAGFDVFGNLGHQLNTRLYMDFLRMEGENNFLVLLPEKDRKLLWDYWYRGAHTVVKKYLYGTRRFHFPVDTGIEYHTDHPQLELYDLLKQRVGKVLDRQFDLENVSDPILRKAMERMGEIRGKSLQWLPQIMILRISESSGKVQYFTLLHNDGFSNVSELFDERKRRRPNEDSLSVVPGIVGAYPNAFFQVDASDLGDFTHQLSSLDSEKSYAALLNHFGVRRTSAEFWEFSDELQEFYLESDPLRSGILDYNRFENR